MHRAHLLYLPVPLNPEYQLQANFRNTFPFPAAAQAAEQALLCNLPPFMALRVWTDKHKSVYLQAAAKIKALNNTMSKDSRLRKAVGVNAQPNPHTMS